MLQLSQIEKPRCSATIDQMRLRRAMALPLEFQYLSSSGFQSEIQVVFRLLIRVSFFGRADRAQPLTGVARIACSIPFAEAEQKKCAAPGLQLRPVSGVAG